MPNTSFIYPQKTKLLKVVLVAIATMFPLQFTKQSWTQHFVLFSVNAKETKYVDHVLLKHNTTAGHTGHFNNFVT